MSLPEAKLKKLRVLNFEDNKNDSELIQAELEAAWNEVEMLRVDQPGAGGGVPRDLGRHESTRVRAHLARLDQPQRAERQEIGGPRAGADEMDRHAVAFVATHWMIGR